MGFQNLHSQLAGLKLLISGEMLDADQRRLMGPKFRGLFSELREGLRSSENSDSSIFSKLLQVIETKFSKATTFQQQFARTHVLVAEALWHQLQSVRKDQRWMDRPQDACLHCLQEIHKNPVHYPALAGRLSALVREPDLPLGLVHSLTQEFCADTIERVGGICQGVLPALRETTAVPLALVTHDSEPGVASTLRFDLVGSGSGGLFSHPALGFVDRDFQKFPTDPQWSEAERSVKEYLEGLCIWPGAIRWGLRLENWSMTMPLRLRGNSSGLSFALGLLKLFTLMRAIKESHRFAYKLRALDLLHVLPMAAVSADGALHGVFGIHSKYLAARDKFKVRINVIVVAAEQEEELRREYQLNDQNNDREGIHFLFSETIENAVNQLDHHLGDRWKHIIDYEDEFAKHRDFYPREALQKTVEELIASKPSGFILLRANPFFGKSAFATQLFSQCYPGAVIHFFKRGRVHYGKSDHAPRSWDDPDVGLASILGQLRRNYPQIPDENSDPQSGAVQAFIRLLGQVSQVLRPGEKVVIIFDGLDEAIGPSGRFHESRVRLGHHFLSLLSAFRAGLPRGIVILFTGRPGDYLNWLADEQCCLQVPLSPLGRGSREEIRDYFTWRNDASHLGLSTKFIEDLTTACDGLFGLAPRLLARKEKLAVWQKDPSKIPQGLTGWLKEKWQDVVRNRGSSNRLSAFWARLGAPYGFFEKEGSLPVELIRGILGLLALAPEHVSSNELTELLATSHRSLRGLFRKNRIVRPPDAFDFGAETGVRVKQVIEVVGDWFDPFDSCVAENDAKLQFFHTYVPEFILGQNGEHNVVTSAELNYLRRVWALVCQEVWDKEGPLRKIALRWLPALLKDAGMLHELYHLSRNEAFFAAQEEQFPEQPDIACETLMTALVAARDADDAAHMAEFTLAHAVRVERIRRISPLQAWQAGNPQRAIRLAERHDPALSALWLLCFLNMPNISEEDTRLVIRRLVERQGKLPQLRASDWQKELALEWLRGFAAVDPATCCLVAPKLLDSDDLVNFANHLIGKEQFKEAIFMVSRIRNGSMRDSALEAVTKAVVRLEHCNAAAELLRQTLAVAQAIVDERYKAYAIQAVANAGAELADSDLSREVVRKANAMIREIRNEDYRCNTLVALARTYARLGDTESSRQALEEVLSIARETIITPIGEISRRVGVLECALQACEMLGESSMPRHILEEMLRIARNARDVDSCNSYDFFENTLRSVIRYCGKLHDVKQARDVLSNAISQFPRLKSWAHGILEAVGEASGLLPDLDAASDVLLQILLIEPMNKEEDFGHFRCNAIQAVATASTKIHQGQLAGQLLTQALSAAQTIEYPRYKAEALNAVIRASLEIANTSVGAQVLQQTLSVARLIQDREHREKSLIAIAQASAKLSDFDVARKVLGNTIDAARAAGDDYALPFALISLAETFRQSHDTKNLLRILEEALSAACAIREKPVDHELRGGWERYEYETGAVFRRSQALVATARAFARSGDGNMARSVLQLARIDTEVAVKKSNQGVAVVVNVGICFAELGDWNAYQQFFRQSLSVIEKRINAGWASLTTSSEWETVLGALGGVPNAGQAGQMLAEVVSAMQTIKDDVYRADCLMKLLKCRALPDAVWTDILSIIEGLKDEKRRSDAFEAVVRVCTDLGNPMVAQRVFQQALSVAQSLGTSQISVVRSVVEACIKLPRTLRDGQVLSQAFSLVQSIRDDVWRGEGLRALLWLYPKLGDSEVRPFLYKVISQVQLIKDVDERCEVLAEAAAAFRKLGDSATAQEILAQTMSAGSGVEANHSLKACYAGDLLAAVAKVYGEMENSEETLHLLTYCISLAQTIENKATQCRVLTPLARAYARLGDGAAACQILRQALSMLPSAGSRNDQLEVFAEIVEACSQLPDAEAARKLLEVVVSATPVFKSETNYPQFDEERALLTIARAYAKLGDAALAQQFVARCQRDLTALSFHLTQEAFHKALTEMMGAQLELGDRQACRDLLAQETTRDTRDSPTWPATLARWYAQLGDFFAVGQLLERASSDAEALNVAKEDYGELKKSSALCAVGQIHGILRELQHAREMFQQAFSFAMAFDAVPEQSFVLTQLAEAQVEAGLFREAVFTESQILVNWRGTLLTHLHRSVAKTRSREALKQFLPSSAGNLHSAWIIVGGLIEAYPEATGEILLAANWGGFLDLKIPSAAEKRRRELRRLFHQAKQKAHEFLKRHCQESMTEEE